MLSHSVTAVLILYPFSIHLFCSSDSAFQRAAWKKRDLSEGPVTVGIKSDMFEESVAEVPGAGKASRTKGITLRLKYIAFPEVIYDHLWMVWIVKGLIRLYFSFIRVGYFYCSVVEA